MQEAIWKPPRVSLRTPNHIHGQLHSAYRKDPALPTEDRELELYNELKAKSRERTGPRSVERS